MIRMCKSTSNRHSIFCSIPTILRCGTFTSTIFENLQWLKQQNLDARRWFTSYQASILQHELDLSSPSSSTDDKNLPEATFDWFANRYQDTSFHKRDGLNPGEWLLVYRILDEKQKDRLEYSLYAIAVGSLACGCFIFSVCMKHRHENPFALAPGFIFAGIMALVYATRLRRYGVIRLYTRKFDQEQWERWRISQLLAPPEQRNLFSPIRHYRIVWTDLLRRHRLFSYTSRQVTNVVNRPRWLARALNGNFLVGGRPWAVHPEFFVEPPDYIFIRRF